MLDCRTMEDDREDTLPGQRKEKLYAFDRTGDPP